MENIISDTHKVAYLLVEVGSNGSKRTLWRPAGRAYPCRDGSYNLKLDIHPGLVFNIRDPKSKSESDEINDRTFDCENCELTYTDEEAHALVIGGAVCDKCYNAYYKDCSSCGSCFPQTYRGDICGKCQTEKRGQQ